MEEALFEIIWRAITTRSINIGDIVDGEPMARYVINEAQLYQAIYEIIDNLE